MLKPLTSFRFLAAFFVFLSHLSFFTNYEDLKWIYNTFFYEGYLGVTFFFLLSGFILTYNYIDKFNSLTKSSLAKFYNARLARIYPVHILTFFMSIPFLSMVNAPIWEVDKAIPNLLLLQSFIPESNYFFAYNAVSWSLSNEVVFYAIMPFLLYFFVKFQISKKPLLIAGGIWLISFLIAYLFRDIQMKHWVFYIFPLFRIGDFLVGSLLALLYMKKKDSFKANTLMEATSIGLLALAVYFSPNVDQTLRYGVYYVPFMAVIIYVFAHQKGNISNFLSSKLFLFLGEISFSFYMVHYFVINYAFQVPIVNGNPLYITLFSLLVSLIGSSLIYLYYEIPMRNKLRNGIVRKMIEAPLSKQEGLFILGQLDNSNACPKLFDYFRIYKLS